MKSVLISFSLMLFTFFSCEKTGEENRNADREALDKLKDQIEEMVDDIPCENSSDWSFTALGSKSCGGPMSYIAYPSSIDEQEFLSLVERYTQGEKDYNKKYNIISDCMAIQAPKGVDCQEGKPVLTYMSLDVD